MADVIAERIKKALFASLARDGFGDLYKGLAEIVDEECQIKTADDVVQVGVGVMLLRGYRADEVEVLLGQRKGAHGAGEWAFPGGKPNVWETPDACAIRETFEETSMLVRSVRKFAFFDEQYKTSGKHFVTLFYVSREFEGLPELMEPEKCEGWRWFKLTNLPSPLMPGCVKALELLRQVGPRGEFLDNSSVVPNKEA